MIPHAAFVRITHWVAALCFLALVVTGVELIISHPRFYWGEEGNVELPALFSLPIPSSRASVVTGYSFVLPDQNGWSRSLHFQSAWFLLAAGFFYVFYGLRTGHFRRNLLSSASAYNSLQRLTYLEVVFFLVPLMIWTGLAMSPGFVALFPATVTVLGGHQSARTIHFFAFLGLVLFFIGHVVMVIRAGFRERTLAMITGPTAPAQELQ